MLPPMSSPPGPLPPVDPQITLADWLREHYWQRRSPRWSPGTIEFRDWTMRCCLIPDLGHRPIVDLSVAELERWIGWRAITPFQHSGRIPKHATLKAVLNTLSAALRMARLDGLIPMNPAKGISLPRDIADPPTVWSPDQVQAFLDATARTRYALLWRLLFATGMRRGEALGLRWSDLNEQRSTVSIRRSLNSRSRDGDLLYGPPKNRTSRRTITLDAGTLEKLLAWRAKQHREFTQRNRIQSTEDPIFTTHRGTPMLPGTVSDAWRAAVARTGLPRMRLHDIRHTHLSHLLRSGEPIMHVAARAGHGTPYQTLTTYAHVIPGDDERTARRAGEMFE